MTDNQAKALSLSRVQRAKTGHWLFFKKDDWRNILGGWVIWGRCLSNDLLQLGDEVELTDLWTNTVHNVEIHAICNHTVAACYDIEGFVAV